MLYYLLPIKESVGVSNVRLCQKNGFVGNGKCGDGWSWAALLEEAKCDIKEVACVGGRKCWRDSGCGIIDPPETEEGWGDHK